MLRLRVEVPDRPGSLAVVAATLAACGADVAHLTVMHRSDGTAVDDIWLSQAAERRADLIVADLQKISGVRVLGRRKGAMPIEFDAQLDFLAYLFAAPQRSVEAFVEMLPAVVDADWAAIRDDSHGHATHDSHMDSTRDSAADEVVQLSAPGGLTLLIGRTRGLSWHRAEIRRVVSVLELASLLISGAGATPGIHAQRTPLTSKLADGYAEVGV